MRGELGDFGWLRLWVRTGNLHGYWQKQHNFTPTSEPCDHALGVLSLTNHPTRAKIYLVNRQVAMSLVSGSGTNIVHRYSNDNAPRQRVSR